MNCNDLLYKQLKALRYDLDALAILELQNTNNPTKLEQLSQKKAEIIRETAMVVLANEWDSDDVGGINTSQDTIKSLKHFVGLITSLESMLLKTIRPDLKQDLQEGIKDCIEHMQTALITRSEQADKEDIPLHNPQITQTPKPVQSIKDIVQETPQSQTKEL
ncbi:hypothetical protein [Helicobacter bizzozeronii]|nr:hypothetical protein [Helicobacter bizzozeronii]